MNAYVALGSNLGDRLTNLKVAVERLGQIGRVRAGSSVYETAPRELEEQPAFLNAVVMVESSLSATAVVATLLKIETEMGRNRTQGVSKGPRVLDLDLLMYGDLVVDEDGLQVPHPRMQQRLFVLEPLAGIASEVMHPTLGRTIGELKREAERAEEWNAVRWFAPPLL